MLSDGPTLILVNLYVRSFEKIDDVKMEFSVQITFRQVNIPGVNSAANKSLKPIMV